MKLLNVLEPIRNLIGSLHCSMLLRGNLSTRGNEIVLTTLLILDDLLGLSDLLVNLNLRNRHTGLVLARNREGELTASARVILNEIDRNVSQSFSMLLAELHGVELLGFCRINTKSLQHALKGITICLDRSSGDNGRSLFISGCYVLIHFMLRGIDHRLCHADEVGLGMAMRTICLDLFRDFRNECGVVIFLSHD